MRRAFSVVPKSTECYRDVNLILYTDVRFPAVVSVMTALIPTLLPTPLSVFLIPRSAEGVRRRPASQGLPGDVRAEQPHS